MKGRKRNEMRKTGTYCKERLVTAAVTTAKQKLKIVGLCEYGRPLNCVGEALNSRNWKEKLSVMSNTFNMTRSFTLHRLGPRFFRLHKGIKNVALAAGV
jgi:hypothetical protein